MNTIKITKIETGTPIPVYRVNIETASTTWEGHFSSKLAVETFIQGVKAGAAAGGLFNFTVDWGDIP